MSGILISSNRNQNMLILYMHVFCHYMHSLDICPTDLTFKGFKCLHMKKHLHEVISETFVERSSRLNSLLKNISKKTTYNILVPSQRYQDFWQLSQSHTKIYSTLSLILFFCQYFKEPLLLKVLDVAKITITFKLIIGIVADVFTAFIMALSAVDKITFLFSAVLILIVYFTFAVVFAVSCIIEYIDQISNIFHCFFFNSELIINFQQSQNICCFFSSQNICCFFVSQYMSVWLCWRLD